MTAVFKRELRSYFRGFLGYLVIALLLLLIGFFYTATNFILANPAFEYTLVMLAPALVILVPLLAMHHRKTNADQLLVSLPISTCEIVLGKYLATLTVLAIPVAVSGLYVLLLVCFGKVNLLAAYAGLLAFLLLGGALLAVCQFLSSLVPNQAIAAILGILASVLLYLLSFFSALLPTSALAGYLCVIICAVLVAVLVFAACQKPVPTLVSAAVGILPASGVYLFSPKAFCNLTPRILDGISPFVAFNSFAQDLLFDWRGILLFISYIVLFLFLTVISVGKRRA